MTSRGIVKLFDSPARLVLKAETKRRGSWRKIKLYDALNFNNILASILASRNTNPAYIYSSLVCHNAHSQICNVNSQSRYRGENADFHGYNFRQGSNFCRASTYIWFGTSLSHWLKSGQIMNKDDIQKRILRNILSRN